MWPVDLFRDRLLRPCYLVRGDKDRESDILQARHHHFSYPRKNSITMNFLNPPKNSRSLWGVSNPQSWVQKAVTLSLLSGINNSLYTVRVWVIAELNHWDFFFCDFPLKKSSLIILMRTEISARIDFAVSVHSSQRSDNCQNAND